MIGFRLTNLRKDRGMTQDELARMLSVSKFTISSYENDKTMPSDEIKIQLAHIFHVSVDYLLGLIDDPLPFERNKNCIYLPNEFTPVQREDLMQYISFLQSKQTKKLERV